MLVLKCQTEIPLCEPSADGGYVQWIDVTVAQADTDIGRIGSARVAIILGGPVMNHGESIHDVLDADSQELCDLDEVFYDDGHLKEAYENGEGQNVLYFSEIDIAPQWTGKMIEEVVVDRILDTLGNGCAIAVMPVSDKMEAARWEALGFTEMALAPRAMQTGYVARDQSLKQPRVRECGAGDDEDRFEIRPHDADDEE